MTGPAGRTTTRPRLAPYLAVPDAAGLLRFLEAVLQVPPSLVEAGDDGRITHAEVVWEDGVIMLSDQRPDRPPFRSIVHLYVGELSPVFERARKAGGIPVQPPIRAPDGLWRAGVRDPWGNEWWFSELPEGSRREVVPATGAPP